MGYLFYIKESATSLQETAYPHFYKDFKCTNIFIVYKVNNLSNNLIFSPSYLFNLNNNS